MGVAIVTIPVVVSLAVAPLFLIPRFIDDNDLLRWMVADGWGVDCQIAECRRNGQVSTGVREGWGCRQGTENEQSGKG